MKRTRILAVASALLLSGGCAPNSNMTYPGNDAYPSNGFDTAVDEGGNLVDDNMIFSANTTSIDLSGEVDVSKDGSTAVVVNKP